MFMRTGQSEHFCVVTAICLRPAAGRRRRCSPPTPQP